MLYAGINYLSGYKMMGAQELGQNEMCDFMFQYEPLCIKKQKIVHSNRSQVVLRQKFLKSKKNKKLSEKDSIQLGCEQKISYCHWA